MEINTLFGLPAHPLLVHLPVVFVPMAALWAIIWRFSKVLFALWLVGHRYGRRLNLRYQYPSYLS